jgi:hypothetical protein
MSFYNVFTLVAIASALKHAAFGPSWRASPPHSTSSSQRAAQRGINRVRRCMPLQRVVQMICTLKCCAHRHRVLMLPQKHAALSVRRVRPRAHGQHIIRSNVCQRAAMILWGMLPCCCSNDAPLLLDNEMLPESLLLKLKA